MKLKRGYLFSLLIVITLVLGYYIPAKVVLADSTPIMGPSQVLATQMIQYYQKNNSTYPYSGTNLSTINAFVSQVIDEANYEGVRPDVAFAQMMKETNFLKFGGDVQVGQYNFGGLGATGGGVQGESFNDPIIGIRAVIQHLKAYATTAPLNRPQNFSQWEQPYADTRYTLVSPKGKANNSVEALSGTWAADPNYGTDIVSRVNTMKSLPIYTIGTTQIEYINNDYAATGIWNFQNNGTTINNSLAWRSGVNSFDWQRSKVTSGDFNGDGKTDVAILYDYGNNTTGLWLFLSNGTSYNPVLAWMSGANSFSWDRSKITSGDYNGDGKDDIAIIYNYGNNTTGIWKFQSSGTTTSPTFLPKLAWISGNGCFAWDRSTITSGDYNGDGKADIAIVYNYGNNTTGLWNFTSNGTSFNPSLTWISGVGEFSWNSSKVTSGDFDGGGKDEIGILYNYGNNRTGIWLLKSNGTKVNKSLAWISGVGEFSWDRSKLAAGDFAGDTKKDMAVLYDYGNSTSGLFIFTSNGSTVTPGLQWKSATGKYPWDRSLLVAGNPNNSSKDGVQVIFNYAYHKTIVLDPGHGGYDPGAVANGIRESDINLGVALKVRDILKSQGYDVLMTRTDDTYVGLQERADFSNASGGDIFVSLHSDSNSDTTATGSLGTYYHYGEGYAIDSNSYNAIADNNWQLNKDLAQKLAYNVAINTGQNQRPSESHSFAVLWRNNLPATLIEMGFVSNPTTAGQMATYDWQYRAAKGIADGIKSYFTVYP